MNARNELMIDLVIPVNDPSRPLQRAIDSLLQSGLAVPEVLRITVVCHRIARAEVEAILDDTAKAAVRFLEFDDGEPSPAGPFMHGLANATAKYVSIMGSDDTLEPGTAKAWLQRAESSGSTALIPPERHASGRRVTTPPTRPFRRSSLDPLRDRLAYRTAPLGLIRLEAIERLRLHMPARLRSGSDQLFGLKLWFSGERVVYARGTPRYIVGADAQSRVTFTRRTAEEELRAVAELVADPWFLALSVESRQAIVTKTVRVHVFSAAMTRSESDTWTEDDRRYLRELFHRFDRVAPLFERPLSRADRRLIDALRSNVAASTILELARARRRFGSPGTLLTRDLAGLVAVDGPVRFMIASAIL